MRFGELLLSTQTVQWADKYLSYNELKMLLNDIVEEKLAVVLAENPALVEMAPTPRRATAPSPTALTDTKARDGPEAPLQAPFAVPSHANFATFRRFRRRLDRNLEQIDAFYQERLAALQLEAAYLERKRDRLAMSGLVSAADDTVDDTSSSCGAESIHMVREDPVQIPSPSLPQFEAAEAGTFRQRVGQQYLAMRRLRAYCELNLLGLSKLLKKHDKLLLGSPFLQLDYQANTVPSMAFAASADALALVEARFKALWTATGVDVSALEQMAQQDQSLAPRDLPFELVSKYSTFLLDMDGVIYHGNRLLPRVREFVAHLVATGKKFLFLTNSSDKTPDMLSAKLHRLGIDVAPSHFFTSAMATAAFLASQCRDRSRRTAFIVGDAGLRQALDAEGFTETDESPEYVVIGETKNFTYADICKATNLVRGGARLIGTNPDSVDKVENGYDPSVGSLIAPIQVATDVKPYFVGKPNPLMFLAGLERVQANRAETIIIGDRMDTDIVGGLEANIGTLLVLSGVTQLGDLAKYQFRPRYILGGIDELVQISFANKASRKDLILLSGGRSGSAESLCD